MRHVIQIVVLLVFCLQSNTLFSGIENFTTGPVIKEFGETAPVDADTKIDSNHKFNVVFDVGKQGDNDKPNRNFNSLARFINLHAKAGVKPENINLALVVHGKAANDLLNSDAYKKKFELSSPNSGLLSVLLKNNVEIYLCGQTAAYYDIEKKDLHAGVQMSQSAMTAHALLQQQGYTLNPF